MKSCLQLKFFERGPIVFSSSALGVTTMNSRQKEKSEEEESKVRRRCFTLLTKKISYA